MVLPCLYLLTARTSLHQTQRPTRDPGFRRGLRYKRSNSGTETGCGPATGHQSALLHFRSRSPGGATGPTPQLSHWLGWSCTSSGGWADRWHACGHPPLSTGELAHGALITSQSTENVMVTRVWFGDSRRFQQQLWQHETAPAHSVNVACAISVNSVPLMPQAEMAGWATEGRIEAKC